MKINLLLEDVINTIHSIVSITESIELKSALYDIINILDKNNIDYALIGGLALSFLTQPRATQDIDIILKSEDDLSRLKLSLDDKFKKYRSHAIEHKRTGVEIELLTPSFLNIDQSIFDIAINTAKKQKYKDGFVNVIDHNAIVALKLFRASRRDLADIEDVARKYKIDVSDYNLDIDKLKILSEIINDISKDY